MAKTAKKFSIGIYDRKHLKNLAKRLKTIEGILGASITEGCKIGMLSPFSDKEKEFYFNDYPEVEKKIDALMKKMHDNITSTIEEGDREAWMLSAQKNDALVDSLAEKTGISKEQIRKWKQPNLEALDAFQERKTEGMSLSDRVWNLTDQFKQELELALDLGLGAGKSAAALSRDVRQYLNEPNKLFRRVRDKHGVLRLSKAAKAYHPGRGVYRSSYKNALRLTATETNMAYRTADHERWQQLDFVTGIEIKLSNNHNCKGIPKGAFRDICDTLAGRYPKDFKFVGWHPFCRCQATPILAPWEQFLKSINEKTPGEPMAPFKQETEYPQQFQEWVKDNKQKLQTAKKLPYFVKDNQQAFMDVAGVKIAAKKKGFGMGRNATKKALDSYPENYIGNSKYTKEQLENFTDVEKVLGIKRGKPMSFQEADSGNENIIGHDDNCACCVVAHEMRRRGFDITACQSDEILFDDTSLPWITKKGKKPETTKLQGTLNEIEKAINKNTSDGGRYTIMWDNKMEDGHIICMEKVGDVINLYDPQKGIFWSIDEIFEKAKEGTIEMVRIDRLLTNTNHIKRAIRTMH